MLGLIAHIREAERHWVRLPNDPAYGLRQRDVALLGNAKCLLKPLPLDGCTESTADRSPIVWPLQHIILRPVLNG